MKKFQTFVKGCLILSFMTLFATASAVDVTINNTAGGLYNAVMNASGVNNDPTLVTTLTVTGTINPRDYNIFPELINLETLDLSGATYSSIAGEDPYIGNCENLFKLSKVVIPSDITIVTGGAFSGCYKLKDINLENIEIIDYGAFNGCEELNNLNLLNVKQIKGRGLANCSNLTQIQISNKLELIDSYAFSSTGLETFDVPKNTLIELGPFLGSSIKKLSYYNNHLIRFSSFSDMPDLEELICYDPIPYYPERLVAPNNTAVLKVPAFALHTYLNHANYVGFNDIQKLDDDIDEITVEGNTGGYNLILDSTEGLADNFNLTLKLNSSLNNQSSSPLSINKFIQWSHANWEYDDYTYYYSNEQPATAKEVEVNITLQNDRWNFISFPFNVNVSEIVPPENVLWTIREYDGSARATQPENGVSKWIDKSSGVLEAGKGYILHFTTLSQTYDYNFKFPAAKDDKKNDIFAYQNVTKNLNFYDSQYEHNKSWNLVGNPFDCAFDCSYISYSKDSNSTRGPITVWRSYNYGNYTYEAFSADDDLTLLPFESFFVQAIDEDHLTMTFKKEGRVTELIQTRSSNDNDRLAGTSRSIFNLYLTGETGKDRTRLVVNPSASVDYEIMCDASKFMSPEPSTPQIYLIENIERLAINERPLGDGSYQLGVRIAANGTYTISCDTRNADSYNVVLLDKLTGAETDLDESGYTFYAGEGSDDRFTLIVTTRGTDSEDPDMASVDEINAFKGEVAINGGNVTVTAEGAIEIYSIAGQCVASGENHLDANLPQGVYIIRYGKETTKAVVR